MKCPSIKDFKVADIIVDEHSFNMYDEVDNKKCVITEVKEQVLEVETMLGKDHPYSTPWFCLLVSRKMQ